MLYVIIIAVIPIIIIIMGEQTLTAQPLLFLLPLWCCCFALGMCGGSIHAAPAATGGRGSAWPVSTRMTMEDEDGSHAGIWRATWMWGGLRWRTLPARVSHLWPAPGQACCRPPYISRSPAGRCAAALHGSSSARCRAQTRSPAMIYCSAADDNVVLTNTPDFRGPVCFSGVTDQIFDSLVLFKAD